MLNRISIFVLAALLSACGGGTSETNTTSPKLLGLMSVSSAQSTTVTGGTMIGQRQKGPGGGDDPSLPSSPTVPVQGPPAGIRYTLEAPFISQVPLRIVVGTSTYAGLCLYNREPLRQLCVTIDSPLPTGVDLEYTDAALLDPNDDARFLSFVPVVGNSDPQGLAASRFIEALARAAAVWGSYLQQHPQLVTQTNSEFRGSGASNVLLAGTSRFPKGMPNSGSTFSATRDDGCYAEMQDLGLCPSDPNPDPDPNDPPVDPNIPRVDVVGDKPPPYEPPPYVPPTPEPPPLDIGGGGSSGDPSQHPKDTLLAQLTPVAPPCGKLGPGGLLCSIMIFGKKPPPLPASKPEPIDRGHQFFAPQILCDWHILCNEGQEPRDNDRGPGSETRGKTQTELDQICTDINIAEIRVCNAIIKAKGSTGQDLYREIDMCKKEADKRMFACFETAKKLTDNGAHPAP